MASLAPWTAPCRQLCQISTEMFTERRHAGAELPKIRRSRYTRSTCALSNADYWHSRHGSVVIEFLSSLTGDGSDHQRSRRRNQWSSSSLKPLYRAKLDLIDLIYGNKRSINRSFSRPDGFGQRRQRDWDCWSTKALCCSNIRAILRNRCQSSQKRKYRRYRWIQA